MLELEMQKLTAAITALIEELRSAKVGNELPTEKETSTNPDKPRQKKPKVTQEEVEALVEAAKPVENSVVTDQPLKDKVEEIVSAITADDLKTVAMEIARADSSARPLILSILSLHGAKTITQLDPKHYQEVHAELMSIAYDIAKNGEVTQ
jgi:hypothetical protein